MIPNIPMSDDGKTMPAARAERGGSGARRCQRAGARLGAGRRRRRRAEEKEEEAAEAARACGAAEGREAVVEGDERPEGDPEVHPGWWVVGAGEACAGTGGRCDRGGEGGPPGGGVGEQGSGSPPVGGGAAGRLTQRYRSRARAGAPFFRLGACVEGGGRCCRGRASNDASAGAGDSHVLRMELLGT